MRRSELLHVVDLTVGRVTSVIRISIPARDAGFGVADRNGNRVTRPRLLRASAPDGDCSHHDGEGTGLHSAVMLAESRMEENKFDQKRFLLRALARGVRRRPPGSFFS